VYELQFDASKNRILATSVMAEYSCRITYCEIEEVIFYIRLNKCLLEMTELWLHAVGSLRDSASQQILYLLLNPNIESYVHKSLIWKVHRK
jgi:hypothetical protein